MDARSCREEFNSANHSNYRTNIVGGSAMLWGAYQPMVLENWLSWALPWEKIFWTVLKIWVWNLAISFSDWDCGHCTLNVLKPPQSPDLIPINHIWWDLEECFKNISQLPKQIWKERIESKSPFINQIHAEQITKPYSFHMITAF